MGARIILVQMGCVFEFYTIYTYVREQIHTYSGTVKELLK